MPKPATTQFWLKPKPSRYVLTANDAAGNVDDDPLPAVEPADVAPLDLRAHDASSCGRGLISRPTRRRARWRASRCRSGSCSGSWFTLIPMPSTIRPVVASARMPATFRPPDQTSFGSCTCASRPTACGDRLARDDRELRPQRHRHRAGRSRNGHQDAMCPARPPTRGPGVLAPRLVIRRDHCSLGIVLADQALRRLRTPERIGTAVPSRPRRSGSTVSGLRSDTRV